MAEPQARSQHKSNLVYFSFSLKIWHLLAPILLIQFPRTCKHCWWKWFKWYRLPVLSVPSAKATLQQESDISPIWSCKTASPIWHRLLSVYCTTQRDRPIQCRLTVEPATSSRCCLPRWAEWTRMAQRSEVTESAILQLKMIGKGFYRKWVKSSFEQFIAMQTSVGSTNGWIISQNAEILKFYFSTIFGICDVIKWLPLRGCAVSLVLQCVYTVNSC